MVKVRIDSEEAKQTPRVIWNALIGIASGTVEVEVDGPFDFTPLQQQLQLIFRYDAEVQNGGHGQFIENVGTRNIPDTIAALNHFGLYCQSTLLTRVAEQLRAAGAESDWTDVFDDEFLNETDDAYYKCSPTMNDVFEEHLRTHLHEHIDLV